MYRPSKTILSARAYYHALQQLNRDVRIYLLTAVLCGFTLSGVYSVLLNLYLLRLGYDPSFIGTVNAAGQAAFIFLSIPAGAMGQRWGTRRLIIAGIASYFVGYAMLPLAEFAPAGWQAGWLIGANLITSFGGPLYWTNGNLFMMEKTSSVERNHAFSLRTAFFPLAGFVGSLAGGVLPGRLAYLLGVTLDDPAPYRFSLLLASLLFLPALWAMTRASDTVAQKRVRQVEKTAVSPHWKTAPLALFITLGVVMFLRTAGESAARSFFNVYLDDFFHVPTVQIGTVAAITLLLTVPAALLTPALASRWGNGRVFLVAIIGMGLCMLPLAFVSNWLVAALCYMCLMVFAAATQPTIYVYRLEVVTAVWWALMSGVGGTFHGLGQATATFGGGRLITAVGYHNFFLLATVVTFTGALGFWLFDRTPQREVAREVL